MLFGDSLASAVAMMIGLLLGTDDGRRGFKASTEMPVHVMLDSVPHSPHFC